MFLFPVILLAIVAAFIVQIFSGLFGVSFTTLVVFTLVLFIFICIGLPMLVLALPLLFLVGIFSLIIGTLALLIKKIRCLTL